MRRIKQILAGIIVIGLVSGCGSSPKLKIGDSYVYYVNTAGTALVKEGCNWKEDTPEKEVEHILKAMKEPEESMEFQSAIPKKTDITKFELKDGKADIYFNADYAKMDQAQEVLCRAAIVQSLVQVDGVDSVSFYVDGSAWTNTEGQPIGYMNSDDFVQNIGPALNSYQKVTLKLYYANETGSGLRAEKKSLRYNSNISIEKLIVEQLLKGSENGQRWATLPADTKLLGISVKDGICYVNFDEGFVASGYDMNPKIAVYALVNSLTEEGTIDQVQISVNGETNIQFQGMVDLSQPIARDLDFMKQ